MSILADAFRPYWSSGINNVIGSPLKDLGGWICDEEYQVFTPITSSSFRLQVFDTAPLLAAYAAEITRIATAAFESVNQPRLANPKSFAWLLIEKYYAAFFAAHSLMRMMGMGCGPLGREQGTSILRVGKTWGVPLPKSLSSGLYSFSFSSGTAEFTASTLSGSPHEAFWILFDEQLKKIADDILITTNSFALNTVSRQAVSAKLTDLRMNLSFLHSAKASWLTQTRNAINYDHKFATWYPYRKQPSYYVLLQKHSESWSSDAFEINLSYYEEEDLLRFQASCNFIIALCRETIEDMAGRCSAGKSFHNTGALSYLRLVSTSKNKSTKSI